MYETLSSIGSSFLKGIDNIFLIVSKQGPVFELDLAFGFGPVCLAIETKKLKKTPSKE